MNRIKLAYNILRKMNVDKIILSFIVFLIISSFVLVRIEPEINNICEGMWYCFISFTTIGFGDIVAVTTIGKIITVLVALYGIVLVALITGVLVNYYQEINKIKMNESVEIFMDKLERLPELSKEELKEISDKVKKRKYKI